jgi:membrane-bound lytic murein transglycosylase
MQIAPVSTPNTEAIMTAPLTAQTGAAVDRAVVPHGHPEMIVRHPKTHAWWNFR